MPRKLIAILFSALMLGLPFSPSVGATTYAVSEIKPDGSKLHPHHHRDYRDRYHRPAPRYYDRGRYGRGYYGESRYQTGRCWREDRHGYFRGRPAIVSVRLCRDRYGNTYIDESSTRLIRYIRRHYD